MIIEDEHNNKVKCSIVAKWKNLNNTYIAYTDDSIKNGKKELFVGKIVNDNDKARLYDIIDDNEWAYVNSYLNNHFYNGGEDDE